LKESEGRLGEQRRRHIACRKQRSGFEKKVKGRQLEGIRTQALGRKKKADSLQEAERRFWEEN
jgi:hypothetical protein